MRISDFDVSICHRLPERSFFWKGKQFPVCARCTGIHIGYFAMPIFLFGWIEIGLWWTFVMIIPTYLDGLIQGYTSYKSNNILRVITGLVAGIGSMALISVIGKWIGNQILIIIN